MMRILCLFDYGETTNTGFASVSRNIKKELKKHFGEKLHLDIVAINFFGKIVNDKEELVYEEEDGTFVISAKKTDFKDDDFGRYGFLKLLKENDFDGVFIMQDLGVVQPIIQVMKHIHILVEVLVQQSAVNADIAFQQTVILQKVLEHFLEILLYCVDVVVEQEVKFQKVYQWVKYIRVKHWTTYIIVVE
jgi:hypothetical protein